MSENHLRALVLSLLLALALVAAALATPGSGRAQDAPSAPDVAQVDPEPPVDPGSTSADESTPSPDPGWDDSTRLALAQCLVAEAGWRSETEHALIMHVLLRRWAMRAVRDPGYRLEQMARAYCHVHRVARERSSNGWALGLPAGPLTEEIDPRLPTDPRPMCEGDRCWLRWRSRWLAVQERVAAFERGELRDPMPLAVFFGGPMDGGLSANSAIVWLGPTAHRIHPEPGGPADVLLNNRFYGFRSAVDRAARRLARSR